MTCPGHTAQQCQSWDSGSNIKVLALNAMVPCLCQPVEKRSESLTAESGHFSKNKNKGQSLSHKEKMKERGVFDERRKGERGHAR